MQEHEFLSEKGLRPTYTTLEVLRIIHDKGFDKHQLLQMNELLSAEGARYDPLEFKILRRNMDQRTKKINKKTLADARKGIYEPLRQMKDVLPPKE